MKLYAHKNADNAVSNELNDLRKLVQDLLRLVENITVPFGNMYAYQAAIVVTIGAANVWNEVTTGLTGGSQYLCTFQNSREIAVSLAGKYLVNWSVADTSNSGDQLMATVGINHTAFNPATGHTTIPSGGKHCQQAGNSILNLASGDVVSMFVQNETGANNITIEHITMTLTRVSP